MMAVYKKILCNRIRLGPWLSLIFFICLLVIACRQTDSKGITIIWKSKQATGIAVAKNTLNDAPVDAAIKQLQVRLENTTTAMLGSYTLQDDYIEFKPLIPLTPGMNYKVLLGNRIIGEVQIPKPDITDAAFIINLFPAVDTVPENLLKIYVQFSAPMREGEALQHIALLNEHNDTVPNVFLDLQPELWNTERTILTVWLDPGRIKRDLIPNQQMGNPLQKGKRYTLAISNQWKDAQGLSLRQSFTKKIIVGARDITTPQPQQWKLELPAANTTQALNIQFGEPLDYFLLVETITIINENGNTIKGKGGPLNNGTGYIFLPAQPWQPGRYRLRIATYLEDLAGNNLNRPFDRDMRVQKTKTDAGFVEREFMITD